MNQTFEIEMNVYQFPIGDVLKQGVHIVTYHLEMLGEAKINYNTYDKELLTHVQAMKKWNHYILGQEKILHAYHHLLIFIN
jgi:hypothetical protein